MNYFLAKTDPETYSIDDLARDRKTVWDGVRNPQALRAIREMQSGRPGLHLSQHGRRLHRRTGEGGLRAAAGSEGRQTDGCGLRISDSPGAAHHACARSRRAGCSPIGRWSARAASPP